LRPQAAQDPFGLSPVGAGRIVSRRAGHQAGSVQRDAAAEVVNRGTGQEKSAAFHALVAGIG